MKRLQIITLAAAAMLCACSSPYNTAIRPASEGRNACWNEFSRKFTYAPAFDIQAAEGAAAYRFTAQSEKGTWSFTAKQPTADLSPIWQKIPPSNVVLTVEALDGKDEVIGQIYERRFLRDFEFVPGSYNGNVRPYREAATMAALYIHRMKGSQAFLKSTEPDLELYNHFTYANKIIGGLISVEAKLMVLDPALKEECMTIARNAAAFLIRESRPEGSPLAYFPPTYYGDKVASKKPWNVGKTMTMDACYSANAFLDLYEACGDSLYLRQALHIADTYTKIQREDGSFPIKVDFITGEPVNEVGAMLHPLLNLVRRLEKMGIDDYTLMRQKGEAWMKKVALETFDLTGQFEDVSVEGLKAYENLTNCTAAPYASFLLTAPKPSKQDIRDAEDLIRLCEDQFVHWNELPGKDGVRILGTPCVFEQHKYQMPVDNSSCNVANAYLDLYECTGNKTAYLKAKALIDNLTVVQDMTDGHIPTTFKMPTKAGKNKNSAVWINCSNASIATLLRFANMTEK